MLSAFQTTVDEDEAALAAANTDANLRLALLFRMEKKRSLVTAMHSIATRVKVCNSCAQAWSAHFAAEDPNTLLLPAGAAAARVISEEATEQC